jgi:iron complex transport system substrate-binding protein
VIGKIVHKHNAGFLIIMILVLEIFLLNSCRGKEAKGIVPVADKSISIVDYGGREISLPKIANRVVVMADSALCIVSQLDADDMIVALDTKTLAHSNNLVAFIKNPSLRNLPDVGKTKNPNYEAILSVNPDVVIAKVSAESADIMQRQLGIPVVCIRSIPEIDYDIYRFVGKIIGKEKKAEEVINFLSKKIAYLEEKVKLVEEDKKTVYMALFTSNKNYVHTMPNVLSLSLAGGINVAAEIKNINEWGQCEVSKESILKWNPDFIFVDAPLNDNALFIDDLRKDPILEFLPAVENNNCMYTFSSFELPKDHVGLIASAYYFANELYPELLSTDECDAKINEIYTKIYNLPNYYTNWKNRINELK